MPKNEDGKFKLGLGNKQLLSMFFVVVVLLGVFFVMGYVVGRNSATLANAEPSTARETDSKPQVVDSPVPKQTSAPETATPQPPESPKREAAKAEDPRPGVAQSNQPVAGKTYLQLVATTKHDADAYVEVLRKNSFPALDAQVPEKPGLFRVLVGPVAPGDLNKMKALLQDKGIQASAAIPKTF